MNYMKQTKKKKEELSVTDAVYEENKSETDNISHAHTQTHTHLQTLNKRKYYKMNIK